MPVHRPILAQAMALFCIALATTGPALAEASFASSRAQIAAILADPAVADALHNAPIGSITNTGTAADGADLWQVRVQDCDLIVRVLSTDPSSNVYSVELDTSCR